MKNINGEEINKELLENKINEKLNQINCFLSDVRLNYDIHLLDSDELSKLIFEYGNLYYAYGSFNALNDRGII